MRTFEYRLRPNTQQAQTLLAILRSSRKLYNAGLEELITHYQETGKHMHLYEHDKRHGKAQHPDLPAVVVDTVLKRLHRSFINFFPWKKLGRKVGLPRFKGANAWKIIQFRDATSYLAGSYFHAPKQAGGRLRVNVHRPLEGTFKFGRIVLRPSGWYLQCVCETAPTPLPRRNNAIGLDMGIRYLIADSDGQIVENPKFGQHTAAHLAHAQQRLAKCKQGSHRRWKAKKNVARIHEHLGNQRKDALHKASRRYVDGYQTIAIEDLQVANMARNHHLAFAIHDASWGIFRRYLESKAESAGRQVIAVRPHYTSQQCSQCGAYVQKSLSVRTHICLHCGYVADRDENAARNILQRALQEKARTEPSPSDGEGLASASESPVALKRKAPRL